MSLPRARPRRQYTRTLLFSTVYDILSQVVFRIKQSVRAAYQELSLFRFMIYCASNTRRYPLWPVYSFSTCNSRFAHFFRGFENFNLLNFSHLCDPIDLWES